MEWILFHPPLIGSKVVFTGDAKLGAKPGVYTVTNTDDYNMAGYVTVRDSDGVEFGVNANDLEFEPSWLKKFQKRLRKSKKSSKVEAS